MEHGFDIASLLQNILLSIKFHIGEASSNIKYKCKNNISTPDLQNVAVVFRLRIQKKALIRSSFQEIHILHLHMWPRNWCTYHILKKAWFYIHDVNSRVAK